MMMLRCPLMSVPELLFYIFVFTVVLLKSVAGLSFVPNICFVVFFLAVVVTLINRRIFIATYLAKSMAIFAVFCVFSAFLLQGEEAFQGSYSVVSMLVLITVTDNVKNCLKIDRLVNTVLLSTIILCIWSWISALETGKQLGSDVALINNFAMRVALVALLLLDRVCKGKGNKNIVGFILSMIIIFMTESRGALVISVLISCMMVFFSVKKIGWRKLLLIVFVIGISISVGELSGFLGEHTKRFDVIATQAQNYSSTNNPVGSVGLRLYFMQIGINAFWDNPVFGHGIGTTRHFLSGTHFHNNYIQLLYEVGIIGLLLYLAPIFIVLMKSIRNKQLFSFLLCLFILLYGLVARTYTNLFFYIILILSNLNLSKKRIGADEE